MIQFDNVSKRYTNGHIGLSDVSFTIERGEMVFVTGHSGAGKSTLLKLIMMMEPITHGQIFVESKNLARVLPHQVPYLRRSIGMVFQNPHLLEKHTVFENVALPLMINPVTKQDRGRRVRAALDKVGLLDKENCYPDELSVGEQQRIGIARAVVNRPSLLLADEPTGNLDPALSLSIMQLFEEFNRIGSTVLIATHDLSLIATLPYRMLTLKHQRLI